MAEVKMFQETFPNGLTLLAEKMDHVRSATMTFAIPAGFTQEPEDRLGVGSILTELLTRGAGSLDSQELSNALDNLGTDRSESIGGFNAIFAAGTLARNLPDTLRLYADILLKPHLPEDEIESVQEALLQDLVGLEDSPQDLVMLELKNRFYPSPLNRNRYGTLDGIRGTTHADVQGYYQRYFQPRGAILSVAGAIDWPSLRSLVADLFGGWEAQDVKPLELKSANRESVHVERDTQQTQIALAVPSATFQDEDYYAARGAVGVLSGGMSSRLFTEVREKRGLSYSVYASHDVLKQHAALVCYAGTRTDRAQETLDVLLGEIRRLKDGIQQEELDRLKVTLKTALVMQQESTSARASSMAGDYFNLGRVRSVEEIQSAINNLTDAAILRYLDRYPAENPTVVTLGPKSLG
ncbi:MAG: M16 family metallopeptidase [Fimbriiglobus sp.]